MPPVCRRDACVRPALRRGLSIPWAWKTCALASPGLPRSGINYRLSLPPKGDSGKPLCRRSIVALHRSWLLGHSHNYVSLNFCSNLTASMSIRNSGGCLIGCNLQPGCVPGFDLVAQGGSLTVRNSWMARGGRAALIGFRLDYHAREAGLLQLTTDQRGVVIAVRRASQKAWWIARKYLRERVRDIVGEHILLDAIPYAKQKIASRLENPLCLPIARLAIGEEHDTELTTNEIESGILERQRQRIRLTPADTIVGGLPRSGIVEHRLVE